jgi:hypothetical protein
MRQIPKDQDIRVRVLGMDLILFQRFVQSGTRILFYLYIVLLTCKHLSCFRELVIFQ